MRLSKILALVFLAAAFLTGGDALAQGKQWTKIRIATEGAFRPWNFTEPDGKLNGFEIDLYQDLCARMKVECEISAQSFDGMIPALNAGKFDAIMAGMSATAKREEVIAFSTSYGTTGQSFGVLKSGSVTALPGQGEVYSLDSNEAGALKAIAALKPVLQGRVIGVQTASIAAGFMDKYLKGVVETREYKTTEQHDLDLLAGRVDLIMASMAYLSGVAAKPDFADLAIVGPRFQGGVLGRGSSVGLRKSDPELKTMFDAAINAAKTDGTIQRLSQKWFGFDVTPR
jgi:octopine/nopaline transport system substrate-binding protein